jgi:hypothetical protein
MSRFNEHITVTDYSCKDSSYRYHRVYEDTPGEFFVKVYEQPSSDLFTGKVLNPNCPAHTVEAARTLAKVFWMERLQSGFSDTNLTGVTTNS